MSRKKNLNLWIKSILPNKAVYWQVNYSDKSSIAMLFQNLSINSEKNKNLIADIFQISTDIASFLIERLPSGLNFEIFLKLIW